MLNKKIILSIASAGIALMVFTGSSYAASTDTVSTTSNAQHQGHMRQGPFANLDEATKTQVKSIFDQVKAGTLTQDQAQTQLQALGVNVPVGPKDGQPHQDPLANLDDATKAQVQSIFDQVKAGTLTQDEAQTQLQALGVNMPVGHGQGHQDPFANLDDATKAQAQSIFDQLKDGSITQDEAQTQLQALGVNMPVGQPHQDPFANLDDATKAQVKSIFNQLHAGTITQVEANTQLQALGVTSSTGPATQDSNNN